MREAVRAWSAREVGARACLCSLSLPLSLAERLDTHSAGAVRMGAYCPLRMRTSVRELRHLGRVACVAPPFCFLFFFVSHCAWRLSHSSPTPRAPYTASLEVVDGPAGVAAAAVAMAGGVPRTFVKESEALFLTHAHSDVLVDPLCSPHDASDPPA